MRGKILFYNAGRRSGYIEYGSNDQRIEFELQDSPSVNVNQLQPNAAVEFQIFTYKNKQLASRLRVIEESKSQEPNDKMPESTQSSARPTNTMPQQRQMPLIEPEQQTEPASLRASPSHASEKEYRFLNPYNFVRVLSGILEPDRVLGRCKPPPHDRWVGLSGTITCELTTKTPLFIADAEQVTEADGHKTFRFFRWDNSPTIPASSLRGMVRSMFEAVTNSCFSVFTKDAPYALEHRLPRAPKMIPARIVELDDNGAKLELLDCAATRPEDIELKKHSKKGHELSLTNTGSVRAYAPRVKNEQQGEIFNVRASRIFRQYEDGTRIAAIVKREPRAKHDRYQFFEIVDLKPAEDAADLRQPQEGEERVFGYIHVTGPNIENKHDERVFFDWNDNKTADPRPWNGIDLEWQREIGADCVREYESHLSEYWDRNERFVTKLDEEFNGSKWVPRIDTLPFPSKFYLGDLKLKKDALVYAVIDEKGEVKALRPVAMPRVRYKHTRQEFLHAIGLARCEDAGHLCPACRVFGWVKESAGSKGAKIAYAGRVRFHHASFTTGLVENDKPLAILASPKPTTTSFYLAQPNGQTPTANSNTDYDNSKSRLRGRKVYRRAPEPFSLLEAMPDGMPANDQNRTLREYIDANVSTKFTVEFENLAELELGALLWTLELNGWHHRLGFAKPLGFGSVQIQVTGLEFLDIGVHYTVLDKEWRADQFSKKEKLKAGFTNAMSKMYGRGKSFLELANIIDLTRLLGATAHLPVHYPRTTEIPSKEGKNFEWFMANKRGDAQLNREGLNLPLGLAELGVNDKGLPLDPTREKPQRQT